MTRFTKEMRKRFPGMFEENETGTQGGYCVEKDALVVFYHPAIVEVMRFNRDGSCTEVTNDYPRISAPYLVYLCGGDEEHAKRILKSQSSF